MNVRGGGKKEDEKRGRVNDDMEETAGARALLFLFNWFKIGLD